MPTEISAHPATVAVLVAVLWGLLTASVKLLFVAHEKREDEHYKMLGERVSKLEAMPEQLHGLEVRLGERVTRVESKLPNGAMTAALEALALAVGRMGDPKTVVRSSRRRG